jgi:hypothetical protein
VKRKGTAPAGPVIPRGLSPGRRDVDHILGFLIAVGLVVLMFVWGWILSGLPT